MARSEAASVALAQPAARPCRLPEQPCNRHRLGPPPPRRFLVVRRGAELSHCDREARLIELVLREDDLPVRPDEHAPRHPTVRQSTEQLPTTVGDHWEGKPGNLPPRLAGVLTFKRPDIDDFKSCASEPLMENPTTAGTLLPTALSGRFPEDQQHPVNALNWQAQISQRDVTPRSDAPSQTFNNLHWSRLARPLRTQPLRCTYWWSAWSSRTDRDHGRGAAW